MYDDPYTPFYPGDQWVDWVGMNMYHMGQVSLLLAEWIGCTCNIYMCSPAAVCVASFALSIPSLKVNACDALKPSSRPPASLRLRSVVDNCSNNHAVSAFPAAYQSCLFVFFQSCLGSLGNQQGMQINQPDAQGSYSASVSGPAHKLRTKERKNFTHFSDHNGSLLRRQP